MTIGIGAIPSSGNPATAITTGDALFFRQIFDTLTTYTDGDGVQPGLASSWEASDGAKTWTFTLAEGNTFADGNPVDAKAVCANFAHWAKAADAGSSELVEWNYYFGSNDRNIYSGCQPSGANTAVLRFSRSMSVLPALLTEQAFGIAEPGSLGTKHPVGSGPYQWTPAGPDSAELHLVDSGASGPPTLTFQVIGDPQAMLIALQNGEIDAAFRTGPGPEVDQDDEQLEVVPAPPTSTSSLYLNAGKGALRDADVRQAVLTAIDREQLISVIGGEQATSILPPVADPPGQQLPSFDPAAAHKLLDGRTPKLRLSVRSASESDMQAAEVISANLQPVGITVEVDPVASYSDFYTRVQQGKADMWIGSNQLYNSDVGDYVRIYAKNGTYGAAVPAGSRKKVQTLLDLIVSTPDGSKRHQAAIAVADELVAGYGALPLSSAGTSWVVGPRVNGLQPLPFWQTRLDTVRVG